MPLITSLLPASPGKKTDLLIENFYLPAILIKGKTLRVLPTNQCAPALWKLMSTVKNFMMDKVMCVTETISQTHWSKT